MSDLLSQQNSQNDQNLSGVQNTSPTPFIPSTQSYSLGAENPQIVETPTPVELNPESKELLRKPEIPVPAALKEESNQAEKNNPVFTIVPDLAVKVAIPKVEPKKATLHHIETPGNDLTKKADEEEEDFIKHVEEIHTIV
ncbi:hypothetical protein HYV31_00615 [candidate division WWE3 bacterium]|nr:hypothetical protein [candidate division WWE3 bacterium]